MDTHNAPGDPPEKAVTIDQVIAANMRYWRREARMTQEELGKLIGQSDANVSALERSADDNREKRRFDAQAITEIALALGVPIPALFLPPADDRAAAEYIFTTADGRSHGMAAIVEHLGVPDPDSDSHLTDLYRDRYNSAALTYLPGDWAAAVARFLQAAAMPGEMADQSRRLRERRAELLRTAAELDDLAAAIDRAAAQ